MFKLNKWQHNILLFLMIFTLALVGGCGTESQSAAGAVTNAETSTVDSSAKPEPEEIGEGQPEQTTVQEADNKPPAPNGTLLVHYIDVDQGDATLLQGPDFNILIDTGRHDRDDLVPYLKSVGINRLEVISISHAHSDHIGQLDKVMKNFAVEEVWMSGDSHTSKTFERGIEAVLNSGAAYHEPRAGETFTVGSAFIEVIHPETINGDLNNGSISMKITFGDISFLFTGDAEKEAENEMLSRGHDIKAHIFHAGHHGSSTSNTKPFLEAVSPEVIVISAGKENQYQHPHDIVTDRIKSMGIEMYGTYSHGHILVETDGKTYSVKTEKEAKANQQVAKKERSQPNQVSPAVTPTPEPKPEPQTKLEPVATAPEGCVDINSASKQELLKIKHIGEKRVEDLINLRPFSSLDDLTRINGIGAARIKDIKDEGIACVGG